MVMRAHSDHRKLVRGGSKLQRLTPLNFVNDRAIKREIGVGLGSFDRINSYAVTAVNNNGSITQCMRADGSNTKNW